MFDETLILSGAMFDRKVFDAVAPHISGGDLSALGELVWNGVAEWYRIDPRSQQAEPDIVGKRIEREHPRASEGLWDLLHSLSRELGSKNPARELLEMKRRRAGDELMLAISANQTPEKLRPLLAEYQGLLESADLLGPGADAKVMDVDLAQLIAKTEEDGTRIKLLPKSLNQYLRGGVLPGHCVVIFGRVNVGKSTLAIHMSAGFLRQGLKVLYVENEDLLEDTLLRMGCRLVGKDRDWAQANPEKFRELAEARGFRNFWLPDPAPMTMGEIERMIDQLKPDVCVVNQARNLTAGAKDAVSQMDAIAKGLRNIGKRKRVVMVLVTAAREGDTERSGEVKDKAVLEMHDCYSSRTGFPAAADVMIGYGSDRRLKDRNMACLSLCKNKLGKHDGKTEAVIYIKADYDRGLISDLEKDQ